MALSALGAHGGTKEFNFTGQVWRHFQILAQELPNPKVLACPSDRRRQCRDWKDFTDNRHLSYLVGLDADESKSQMILSGDRNLTSTLRATKSASNGVLALGLGDRVEWTQAVHNRAGNIALADGSAFRVTDYCLNKQLRAALATSSQETHRLALPE